MKDLRKINRIVEILQQTILQWKVPAVGVVAGESRDPFKILISCLLSLRTKDDVTESASRRLFARASTPRQMLDLSGAVIRELIYPVGFYKTKALRIRGICRDLIERHGAKVPDSIETLLTLKGVGRKTANLVLTLGFNKDGICVDTHVHRISNRIGLVKTKTPHQTEYALMHVVPRRRWKIINDLMVPFGQNLCRPLSPFCSKCPLDGLCDKRGVKISR